MYYYKKDFNGMYSYMASTGIPKDLDGMIEIAQAEYDEAMRILDEKIMEELNENVEDS